MPKIIDRQADQRQDTVESLAFVQKAIYFFISKRP